MQTQSCQSVCRVRNVLEGVTSELAVTRPILPF
jgi:hypothetical protein